MAIFALIITPLVMNIIRNARVAADKRSIDAYGRSIEYAIAGYLLDNGRFPTSIDQLTIEYSGSEVLCETTQLNSDSSVYLTGCTVAGRTVDYAYGTDKTPPAPTYTAYSVGDEVTYNGVDYYVIKNSGVNDATVTLLKAEPLTVAEVNLYGGVETENNHVNMYVDSNESYYQKARDISGSGGMQYYSSSSCYSYDEYNDDYSGCKIDYDSSEVKYVVDAWKVSQAPAANEARLITFNELTENLHLEIQQVNPSNQGYKYTDQTPSWVYSYSYWTMTPYEDSVRIYSISSNGLLIDSSVAYYNDTNNVVRPVIVISKSVL